MCWLAEIGSTQDEVVAAAKAGAPDGLVVVADHQTGGRGRRGRRWEAQPGSSLLVSVLLTPASPALVPIAAGLAALDACTDAAGISFRLKWPNDVVTESGDKLGGLVAEVLGRNPGSRVVVGLGLNVAWAGDLPPGATDLLRQSGRVVDRRALLAGFLGALERRGAQDARGLLDDYRAVCVTLGRDVRVELDDGAVIRGQARAVGETGALVVEDDRGRRHIVSAGDVVHLR